MRSLYGIDVITSDLMTEDYEDWSACRSPSRAKRRHRRGIKTRMVIRSRPLKYALMNGRQAIMHSQMAKAISQRIEQDIMRSMVVGGEATTYSTYDAETNTLTVKKLKESMYRLKDDYPDIFSYDTKRFPYV